MFERGASVFRLNYRDHGGSHDLNEGLLFSTRFNEVCDGVRKAARLSEGAPVYIVGFSLGGNFALRIARSLRDLVIPKLRRIFAISPVVDPWGAAPLVDANPLYRRYFLKKWSASLRRKQVLYPDLYDFNDILASKRVLAMTEKSCRPIRAMLAWKIISTPTGSIPTICCACRFRSISSPRVMMG